MELEFEPNRLGIITYAQTAPSFGLPWGTLDDSGELQRPSWEIKMLEAWGVRDSLG